MPQSGDECGQVPAGRFADERRAASTARNNFRVVERMRNEAKVILRRKLEWGMCHRRSCRNRRRGGDTFPATVISAGCLVFSRSGAQAERSGNSRQPAPSPCVENGKAPRFILGAFAFSARPLCRSLSCCVCFLSVVAGVRLLLYF